MDHDMVHMALVPIILTVAHVHVRSRPDAISSSCQDAGAEGCAGEFRPERKATAELPACVPSSESSLDFVPVTAGDLALTR